MEELYSKVESMNRGEIEQMQLKMLKKQLKYVYSKSKFYRGKFDDAGIKPDDIKSLGDIQKIPFTTKGELREYNMDFICVRNEKVIDIGTTTGTSGSPVILPVTRNDWNFLTDTNLRSINGIGVTEKDTVQLCMAFDQLFSVSTPIDDTLKIIGATSVRMGPGNTKRQVEVMKLLKTNVIYATPDFMFILAEKAKELGYEPAEDFFLEKGVLVGQPLWRKGWKPTRIKKQIEELWGMEVFSDYGSMELFAGFHECSEHGGHHSFSDYHYLEVVDPLTGESLSPGEEGELVVTHLGMEGVPLVRFRQGDITSIEVEKCVCGRTNPRVMAIIGRVDNMLKIKGTSVYPQQIEDCIIEIEGVNRYVVEAFSDKYSSDRVVIKIFTSSNKEKVREEIVGNVKSRTRITPEIEFVGRTEIEEIIFKNGTRKPKLFWDYRKR